MSAETMTQLDGASSEFQVKGDLDISWTELFSASATLPAEEMFYEHRLRATRGNGFLKRKHFITYAPAANGWIFAGVRRFAMNRTRETKKNSMTIDLVYMALGAVLIAVCSWISIPTTVPFTMQTFAVFFVLSALGGKRGTVAIIVYVLLGAVGVPVFAQFTSGIGILLGNTGGYIVGFIFMGLVYWLIVHFLGKKLWVKILAMVIGLAVCYSFGTVWFMIVYAQANGAVGLAKVLAWCVIPFIIPDLIKLRLALTLAQRLSPVLKLQ